MWSVFVSKKLNYEQLRKMKPAQKKVGSRRLEPWMTVFGEKVYGRKDSGHLRNPLRFNR